MDKDQRSRFVAGVTLIGIGLLLFWLVRVEDLGQSLLFFVIGSLFLGAYLYSKNYGLLIPGCLLIGLGSATLLRRMDGLDNPWQVGLGAGFVAIWLIALIYEKQSHWWPLIPGGILLVTAFSIGDDLMEFLFTGGWPLVLVIIGLIIVLGSFSKRGPGKDAA
ncbi:MAG: hypothetical protein GTN89_10475 [Acidobacteria bacterium]|nr:hypothetical protein [Acidobacteriota bacterium]NIM61910.1 hypothetical protein [Acidobacteriota bacterium]NIO59680.1 hypothetical protein [Acidobacteriota bacterium]NIQ30775.1 hypothetical protein [Acidobacteriota bacterium]NIQ85802.1 hypothetical protein [Acidobacteriota bacterium]